MRLVHISDLHLEGGFNRLSSDKNRLLRDESLQRFSDIIAFARKNGVSAVLICGDLFDKLSVRKSTLKYVLDAIREASEIKFFYCLGNHDHQTSFEGELPENLVIFPVEFVKYDLGEVVIGGVSVLKYSNSDFLKDVRFDKNRLNIFMLHANLASKSGDVLNLDIRDLKNRNIDYLALGHIHTRLNGKIDERGEWVYAGNGGEYSFGDHQQGFVLLEVHGGEISWQRVDFAKRKFLEIELPLDGIENFSQLEHEAEERLKNAGSQNFVRLVLSGECDEQLDKRLPLLTEKFSDKFFYFEVLDKSKIKIDIEKCKLEKLSLKAELIGLIAASQLSENQKEEAIKIGIAALRGEEVEV